jgi:hypothetical protein
MRENHDNIVDVELLLKGQRVVLYPKHSLPSDDVFRRDYLPSTERLLRAYRVFWAPLEAHLTEWVEAALLKELREGTHCRFLANEKYPQVPPGSMILTAPARLLGVPAVIDIREAQPEPGD